LLAGSLRDRLPSTPRRACVTWPVVITPANTGWLRLLCTCSRPQCRNDELATMSAGGNKVSFRKPNIYLVLAAGLAQVSASSLYAGEPNQPKRPNVIVLLTDDNGYGDHSCLGNPVLETPNFDKLHSQSIRLTDFHVAPMCSPTRGQLMTGLDALHNGA